MMETAADTTWKGYSPAERDRRWQAVRDNAAKAGFDCIFIPLCVDGRNLHLSLESARGTRSDCRYLTQLGNAAVILPTDGRPPIVIERQGETNSWVQEVRSVPGRSMRVSWGPVMADTLLELGMEKARIGVSGLKRGKVTHSRADDGVVNHTAYAEVMRRLPNAKFEDATDVLGYARYVKSDEEIECLKRGAAISAAGIEVMLELARPGVDEAILYARVMERLMELGSEYYGLALNPGPLDGRGIRFTDPPIGRRLKPMDYLRNEVDSVWGGLIAQEMQPILLGPIPAETKRLIELHRDAYEAGLSFMKPGAVFGDFIDFINGFGEARGMKTRVLIHGRGYGNDGPILTPIDMGFHIRDVRIEKGNVFVWKPIALSLDQRQVFSWGGCVLVTDKGGVPLLKREHGLVSIS